MVILPYNRANSPTITGDLPVDKRVSPEFTSKTGNYKRFTTQIKKMPFDKVFGPLSGPKIPLLDSILLATIDFALDFTRK